MRDNNSQLLLLLQSYDNYWINLVIWLAQDMLIKKISVRSRNHPYHHVHDGYGSAPNTLGMYWCLFQT
jgi:hypothetical protein